MGFGANRGKPAEDRIRDLENEVARLANTVEQVVSGALSGSGSGFAGGGGGGGVRPPWPESYNKWDAVEGHDHDGTDAGGKKVAHADLTTPGSPLLDGSWHSDTAAATPIRGDLVKANSAPAWDRLPIGGAGTALKSDGIDPAWGQVTHAELATSGGSALLDGARHSDTATGSFASGDLITRQSGAWARLAIGTAGYILRVVTGQPAWAELLFSIIGGTLQAGQHGSLADGDHTGDLTGNARVGVYKNGTLVAKRRSVNIIEGTNVTATVADNGAAERVDVTLSQTSVSAATVIVQEGDSAVVAAADTLDFAASDFDVTESPAGEANIAWHGFAVEEGNFEVAGDVKRLDFAAGDFDTSASGGEAEVAWHGFAVEEGNIEVAGDIKRLDFGAGFDTSASSGEAEIAMDLSEVVTGDVAFTGNAAEVQGLHGRDIDDTTLKGVGASLAYDSGSGDYRWQYKDWALGGWSLTSISARGTTDARSGRVGSAGTNINTPYIPHRAGKITGISAGYENNVSASGGSHIITIYVDGVATSAVLTVTGATDKGSAKAPNDFTAIPFNEDSKIEVYDMRSGTLTAATGVQIVIFGIWEE